MLSALARIRVRFLCFFSWHVITNLVRVVVSIIKQANLSREKKIAHLDKANQYPYDQLNPLSDNFQ
jgi:hypothetical protein